MGINQDAIDLWDDPDKTAFFTLVDHNADYNTNAKTKMTYLKAIDELGDKVSLRDLKNGFLRKYSDLSPCTQKAIKESIFSFSDKKYRKKISDLMDGFFQ